MLENYSGMLSSALALSVDGRVEEADSMLRQMGLSIERRTRFFDVAKDNLDLIHGQYERFLDHYRDLLFGPEPDYWTIEYKEAKDTLRKEWETRSRLH